jgi:hypothetical protein
MLAALLFAVPASAATQTAKPPPLCVGLKGAANQYCQQLPDPGGPVPSGPGAGPGSFFPKVKPRTVAAAAAAAAGTAGRTARQVTPHHSAQPALPFSLFNNFPLGPVGEGGGIDPLLVLLAIMLLTALLAAGCIAAWKRYRGRYAAAGAGDADIDVPSA